VEPKLKAAGWTDQQVTREFFYQRDHQYTPGRIILVGDQVQRGKPRRVDYLLRLTDGFEIAVVEVKREDEPLEAGLEQAKAYAKDLGLAFAYATNGHEILEYDFFEHKSRKLENFPRPEELWYRWKINTGSSSQYMVSEERATYISKLGAERQQNPLLHSYCPESLCGKKAFLLSRGGDL